MSPTRWSLPNTRFQKPARVQDFVVCHADRPCYLQRYIKSLVPLVASNMEKVHMLISSLLRLLEADRTRAWLSDEGQAVHIDRRERAQQHRPRLRPPTARGHMCGAQGHIGLRRDAQLPPVAPPRVRVLEGQRRGRGDDVQIVTLESGIVGIWAASCREAGEIIQFGGENTERSCCVHA